MRGRGEHDGVYRAIQKWLSDLPGPLEDVRIAVGSIVALRENSVAITRLPSAGRRRVKDRIEIALLIAAFENTFPGAILDA